MDPLTITVYDRNVRYMLNDGNQSSGYRTPDGSTHAMFPTNMKYIFENDDDGDEQEADTDEGIENVIIVHLEQSGALTSVQLISDRFELLSYKRGIASTINEDKEKENRDQDVELDVVSQFCDLSPYVHDLPLDELIRLYTIQNEQMQIISNSM